MEGSGSQHSMIKKMDPLTLLPLEVLHQICSHLSVLELELKVSIISDTWKAAADYIIQRRLSIINKMSAVERQDIIKEFPSAVVETLDLLKKHEATNTVGKLSLTKYRSRRKIELPGLVALERCTTAWDRVSGRGVLNEAFQLVSGYEMVNRFATIYGEPDLVHQNNLLKEFVPNKMKVTDTSSSSDRSMSPPTDINEDEPPAMQSVGPKTYNLHVIYGITGDDEKVNHRILDVYHNRILLKECYSRGHLLCEITNVCHKTEVVTCKILWTIYFPFSSSTFRIYCDRVVALFSTGYVGIWSPGSSNGAAEHSISKLRIPSLTKIFRIGHLMLVQSSTDRFALFDVTTDKQDFEMCDVPLVEICEEVFVSHDFFGKLRKVMDLQLTGNILLVKAIADDKYGDLTPVICGLKLRHFPNLSDFLTVGDFKKLVNLEESALTVCQGSSSTLLVPPSIIPGRSEVNDPRVKACFLTSTSKKSDVVEVFDILDSQGTSEHYHSSSE